MFVSFSIAPDSVKTSEGIAAQWAPTLIGEGVEVWAVQPVESAVRRTIDRDVLFAVAVVVAGHRIVAKESFKIAAPETESLRRAVAAVAQNVPINMRPCKDSGGDCKRSAPRACEIKARFPRRDLGQRSERRQDYCRERHDCERQNFSLQIYGLLNDYFLLL